MKTRSLWKCALLVVLVGCGATEPEFSSITVYGIEFSATEVQRLLAHSPVPASPADPTNRYAENAAATEFGKRLFFDTGLSSNGQVSCATCHQPQRDFTDGLRLGKGIGEQRRNTPTLWNVAHLRWFFWDGRSDSLWSQALNPLVHPVEMGSSVAAVVEHVQGEGLRSDYERIFGAIEDTPPDRVFANVGKAIAAYERALVLGPAPFDRFVESVRRGRPDESLSASATRGLKLFLGRGQCTLCHLGPLFTDREFHNVGLDRGGLPLDIGRFGGIPIVQADPFNGLGEFSDDRSDEANQPVRYVTQKPVNLGEFKTPTLRNVARTAPYMHDGRFDSLLEVVEFYSVLDTPALGHREETLVQLELTPTEVADLVAFLESLTSEAADPAVLAPP